MGVERRRNKVLRRGRVVLDDDSRKTMRLSR